MYLQNVTIPKAYKHVYSGGHHQVYCDSHTHLTVAACYGAQPDRYRATVKAIKTCDCHLYGPQNASTEAKESHTDQAIRN